MSNMLTPEKNLIVQTIAENIPDSDPGYSVRSTSSSDSSDSDEFTPVKRVKVSNFMETIEGYSTEDFRKHFRLSRETIASLIELYASSNICPSQNHEGVEKVRARKEIHLFIWYVANTLTYRQLANLFGLGDSTVWKVVNRVASWMVTISHQYIVWPRSNEMVERATTSFQNLGGISGVLGAIDGSHIKIRQPSVNPELYYNRKCYHSILLQAVADSSKRFIDVYCGEPGSMHDARVLRRSPLFHLASQNTVFCNNTYLLGDSAYPANSWIVPPYKDTGNLTEEHKKFNKIHSSTRIVVENAFGLMKCRFRRLLHFTEHIHLGTVKNIVVACCMLHNLCINANHWNDIEIENLGNDNANFADEHAEVDRVQVDRRQQVVNDLRLINLL